MRVDMIDVCLVRDCLFSVILLFAAWQDWRWRSISMRFLLAAGMVGIGLSAALNRTLLQVVLSVVIGGLLLLLSKWTEGGIGEGDGWFFVVSGCYIDWQDNLCLFLSGLFLCFGLSLCFIVLRLWKRKRKSITVPFLPFLLPMGISMMLESLRCLL
ncbi:MAG: prepilin peptidase [Lachnospiraceae bacterium]|nr:prepilin peptidase [Lachnospiraceae bacterium]